jgi:hypothetical protein
MRKRKIMTMIFLTMKMGWEGIEGRALLGMMNTRPFFL